MTDPAGLEWVEPAELAAPDDPVGDALRAGNARYAHALAAADADALCALFEPDGAIIDGDGPDTLGHDGLREMAAYARERYLDITFAIEVAWAKADGLNASVAHAAGTWRMSVVPRGGRDAGTIVRSRGQFANTWHLGADGTWRIHRDLTLTHEPG